MTDLFAARSQMALSLGFHMIFAVVGMGMPVAAIHAWGSAWAVPFQALVALVGLSVIGSLWVREVRLARDLTAVQVALVVGGWAASQWPYVVPPDLTVADAAPANVVWTLLGVLAVGSLPLGAAYVTLLRVFR